MIIKNCKYGNNENVTMVELGEGNVHIFFGVEINKHADLVFKNGRQLPVGKITKETKEILKKDVMEAQMVIRFKNVNSVTTLINQLKDVKKYMMHVEK